jgi:hypothetical protein
MARPNPLEKALAAARQARGLDAKPAAEADEPAAGKSFRVTCASCGSVHRMDESELEPWESDPETSEVDGGDEDNTGDDDGKDSELDPDAKKAFVAKLAARTQKQDIMFQHFLR